MVMDRWEKAARVWADQVEESFRLAKDVRRQIERLPQGASRAPYPPKNGKVNGAGAKVNNGNGNGGDGNGGGGNKGEGKSGGANGGGGNTGDYGRGDFDVGGVPLGGVVAATLQWWLHTGTAWEKVANVLMATGSESEPFISMSPSGTVPTIDIVVDSKSEDICSEPPILTDIPDTARIELVLHNVDTRQVKQDAYADVTRGRLTVNVPGFDGALEKGTEEHWLGVLYMPEGKGAGAERTALATVHLLRIGVGDDDVPDYPGPPLPRYGANVTETEARREGEALEGAYGDAVPPSPEPQ